MIVGTGVGADPEPVVAIGGVGVPSAAVTVGSPQFIIAPWPAGTAGPKDVTVTVTASDGDGGTGPRPDRADRNVPVIAPGG